jgi:hypothetical protein
MTRISVLIPTRERPEPLERCLRSLHDNASRPETVEYLLRTDEDEAPKKPQFTDASFYYNVRELRDKRLGYARLHECYRELGHIARGRIYLIWNDDAVMRTRGWDDLLFTVEPVIQFPGEHASFPAVDRRIFEVMGGFGQHTAVDSWLQSVARGADIYCERPDIDVLHDKHDDDLLVLNRSIARGPNDYDTLEPQRQSDAAKLREWLTRQ